PGSHRGTRSSSRPRSRRRCATSSGATRFAPSRRRRQVPTRGSALMALAEDQRLENPLLAGLPLSRRPEPCAMVIFGASGDLTKRKLFPALYSLAVRQLLPEQFAVVGVARTEESDDDFRERMKAAGQEFGRDEFRDDVWERLAAGIRYVTADFMDKEAFFDSVTKVLTGLDEERGIAG